MEIDAGLNQTYTVIKWLHIRFRERGLHQKLWKIKCEHEDAWKDDRLHQTIMNFFRPSYPLGPKHSSFIYVSQPTPSYFRERENKRNRPTHINKQSSLLAGVFKGIWLRDIEGKPDSSDSQRLKLRARAALTKRSVGMVGLGKPSWSSRVTLRDHLT